MSDLTRIRVDNGDWECFEDGWKASCEKFGEDFLDFFPQSLPSLKNIALENEDRTHSGIFGLSGVDSETDAIFFANCALLKGYDGHVLRVRHVLFSPKYDFGELDVEDFQNLLKRLLINWLLISENSLKANHIKIHLRSPSDAVFLKELSRNLVNEDIFSKVESHGAWISVSKKLLDC
ncbi:MAG: hypothetical protein WD046_10695 [Paracoccaceae bacterium]